MADNEYTLVSTEELGNGKLKLLMTKKGQTCSITLPDGVDDFGMEHATGNIMLRSKGEEMMIITRSPHQGSMLLNFLVGHTPKEAPSECKESVVLAAISDFERATGLKVQFLDLQYQAYGERLVKNVSVTLEQK